MLIGRRLNDYQANKHTHFVRWDAYRRGGFAIMPHMSAPVIGKLCARMNMNNIVNFPTKAVQEWNSFEKTLTNILAESEASLEMTDIVISRMKDAFDDYQFNYNLSLQIPSEVAEHVKHEMTGFTSYLTEKFGKLLLQRVILEIKLAKEQGY